MPENNNQNIRVSNYFTNENPKTVVNNSQNYGIIPSPIEPVHIIDGLTERGAGLGKLGSSMPSPMARLFLFSAAFREVNSIEGRCPGDGHNGKFNEDGELEPTPYHDLVGEMLDMLEFVFNYGDHPDFHVQIWDMATECDALENSTIVAHNRLASALRSAFDFGVLRGHRICLFKWGEGVNEKIIGGTSPISLVYTSANLRTDLGNLIFKGDAGNILFKDEPCPLHERGEAFREYLYSLIYRGIVDVAALNEPLGHLFRYIQDSATNYDGDLVGQIRNIPVPSHRVKPLMSQGALVSVAGIQLMVSDHDFVIDCTTSDYILKPSVNYYKHNNAETKTPLILTKYGVDGLKYAAGRKWNTDSDKIDMVLPRDINDRSLPGFQKKYPFLTVSDFFEEKVIEVSYMIDRKKFFTGCKKEITFLLPLKKVFFEYFSMDDLIAQDGSYTDMLVVEHDEEHAKLTVRLNLPLVNGHTICLHKQYSTSANSVEKLECYDGSRTFDFAVFPFYRLAPDESQNIYNIMVGRTIDAVSARFYEPNEAGLSDVACETKKRTVRGNNAQLATDHIRVKGSFTLMEIEARNGGEEVCALVLPIFSMVDSDPTTATHEFAFSIDFGTTNTHVSYARIPIGTAFGHGMVQPFNYAAEDSQVVMFNNESGVAEFGAFVTAMKRELVPLSMGNAGNAVKFPMRTATYQVAGNPPLLEMFFNTNIGFNYGEDISSSGNYKTNIKWDRMDGQSDQRMSTFFAQMLWMMKNKCVLNKANPSFKLVVTYPISMRPNDLNLFKQAWKDAKREVQCSVDLRYRTESIAPYYSYLTTLEYGEPYANMDIGGGTTDILYVNPFSGEANVFSAFFAANDLWNDGIDPVCRAAKANGFVELYRTKQMNRLGDRQAEIEAVIGAASSSADIISYLFANDSWTRLSNTISCSRKMMQLPVVHFSALAFYMAYSLHMAEVECPRNLSFTGMGSKYIRLISGEESDISKLVNAIFKYAGTVLGNSKLQEANIKISFAPNPKEVTAMGALISLNYAGAINPSEDTYFGFEEEEPGRSFKYKDISADVQDSVVRLFNKFTGVFRNEKYVDVLSDLGYSVDSDVVDKLGRYAIQSVRQMRDNSSSGVDPNDRLKEPMFFWPLKNSLYIIGKELARGSAN